MPCKKLETVKRDSGFTLVEVAIAAMILALVLGSAATLLINYTRATQQNETERRLDVVNEALQLFLDLNGRLPCVADPAAGIDTATFGFEVNADCSAAAVSGGQIQAVGRGGRQVRIGSIPVRTLNIPDEYIADSWGRRFTYAVTEVLATDGTFIQEDGGISIEDTVGNTLTPLGGAGTAHYVVVSHGAEGAGAYDIGGIVSGIACPADGATFDEENCDGNATFISTLLTATADNASFYDDMLIYAANSNSQDEIPTGTVMAFNLGACPSGWIPFTQVGGVDVVGRSIVGAGNYSETEDDLPKNTWDVNETFNVGSTGGFSEWRVDTDESIAQTTTIYLNDDPTDVGLPFSVDVMELRVGDPVPQENRPPYVALLYCQRA